LALKAFWHREKLAGARKPTQKLGMMLAAIIVRVMDWTLEGKCMKGNSFVAMVGLISLITSCAKRVTEVNSAPQTQYQAGVIASCTTKAEAKTIAENLDIRYRVINENRKLVEFFDIKESQLREGLKEMGKGKGKSLRRNIVYSKKLISGDFASIQSPQDYPFYGAHTASYRDENSAQYFKHLEQIDGVNPVNHIQGEGVTIAIVDTGVYYNHPDLSPNIKTNQADNYGEDGNHVDDDNNGYADDYVGWDFYNGDAFPIDDNGHGTHVAGLAAGTLGGIAPRAKILPVKVMSSDGYGDLGTIAAGIMYAIDMGADIVNLSLGGPGASEVSSDIQALISSVTAANNHDALIIAAAGNGGADGIGDCNDANPIYPANIENTSVISVAAVDSYNEIADYSNFGFETVHVAAPGGDTYSGGLLSTGIPSCYGPCSQSDQTYKSSMGTSMATPIVAGLAALIKSANSNLNHIEIKEIIMEYGINIEGLKEKITSGQVINVKNAVTAALQ